LIQVKERFEPNPDVTELYDARYEVYKRIYPTLRDLLHAM